MAEKPIPSSLSLFATRVFTEHIQELSIGKKGITAMVPVKKTTFFESEDRDTHLQTIVYAVQDDA